MRQLPILFYGTIQLCNGSHEHNKVSGFAYFMLMPNEQEPEERTLTQVKIQNISVCKEFSENYLISYHKVDETRGCFIRISNKTWS